MKRSESITSKNIIMIILILGVISFVFLQISPTGFQVRRINPIDGGGFTTTTILSAILCNDNDHDGFGLRCLKGNDCDDFNKNINPGMKEICGNLIDEDCDTLKTSCSTLDVEISIESNSKMLQGDTLQIPYSEQ